MVDQGVDQSIKVETQSINQSINEWINRSIIGGDTNKKVEGGGDKACLARDHSWLLLLPVAGPSPAEVDDGAEEGKQGELLATYAV